MSDDTTDESSTEKPPVSQSRRHHRERPQQMDFSPSSTATAPSDAAQDESETMKTGRHSYTENATFILGDIPAASDKWDTLNQANRDFFVDQFTDEDDSHHDTDDPSHIEEARRRQDHVNDTVGWGQQIGLTDYEIRRAVMFVLNAEDAYKRNHSIEGMILAALTLAANEGRNETGQYTRSIRTTTPILTESDDAAVNDGVEQMQTTYTTIRDRLGVDPHTVTQCRTHLRDAVLYDNN